MLGVRLVDPLPISEQQWQLFRDCREPQCILGVQALGGAAQLTIGMLLDSASVVLNVQPGLITSIDVVDALRKELLCCFDEPGSVSISDVNPAYLTIARDRDIPAPSVYFGSGMDWYAHVSPEVWRRHYSREVLLGAPARPHILEDGSIEWFTYESLLHFDAAAVTANRRYLGERKSAARGCDAGP